MHSYKNETTPKPFKRGNQPLFYPCFTGYCVCFNECSKFRFKVFFHLFVLTLKPFLPRRLHSIKIDIAFLNFVSNRYWSGDTDSLRHTLSKDLS
ncbi:hypothetical protein Pcar_3283 [Syntrophotalea carbinolica DSM 2380]|uniref:Uncharacterized protein n=1 Tax=Syntrophotalea carbinolica (strain DSM 2380 / NBRC 103641 / GraBd1) TaxID=338963 RepID=Q0C6N5_SYNC1|nr:hypothetical protein Pcar_3283 [Syntrophotalea carbinolica DSM 2380]